MTDSPASSDSEQNSANDEDLQGGWFSHVRMVSILTFLSRMLGLVRDVGMAALFGNGPLLDAFTLAFRLPNMSRRLLGEGALTTAFLPAYVKELKQDPLRANRLASAVLFILLLILSFVVLVGELGLYGLASSHVLGTSSQLILSMTAWLLPYVVLICLSAQLTAILHSLGHFAVPALVPVLLNVVWIFALWVIVPGATGQETQIAIIISAILLGGVGQLILPWWVLHRKGFRIQTKCTDQIPQAVRVFRSMLPIVIGLSVTQLNALCDGALAWWYARPEQGEWIASGTASALYYGQRLYQFPLGVFGIALGTVLFARLAHHVEAGNRKQISQDVAEGLRLMLTIGCPASVGLILLATPLADCLLRHGQFDAHDAQQTAATIAAYGTAIWAFLGISLTQRVYYALGDAQTPVRIGLICVAMNLALNFLFMNFLGGVGLAYATALSAGCQFLGLIYFLRAKIELHFTTETRSFFGKVLLSTLLMAAGCWGLVQWFGVEPVGWMRMLRLVVPLVFSVFIYWGLLRIFRIRELDYILGIQKTLEITPKPLENDEHLR
ncbi:MAG: murein biosynthesis integral membrane protein MurJ [Planctomycetaceae bacterium]|nr:murein biosynthesis integral membrane protein MurJ [Planctomycetaceae bacterium]